MNSLLEHFICPLCATVCLRAVFSSDGGGGHPDCIKRLLQMPNLKSMISNLPLEHKLYSPSRVNETLCAYFLKNTDMFDPHLNDIVNAESIETLMMIIESDKLLIVDPAIVDKRLIECATENLDKVLMICHKHLSIERRDIVIKGIFVILLKGENENKIIHFLNKCTVSNYVDKNGNTPLLLACHKKMKNVCIKLLDDQGCQINHINNEGTNALMMACINNMEDICMKILDQQNIQINHTNMFGNNALLIACAHNMENVCIKILDNPECQINHANVYGDNILIKACGRKMENVCMNILDRPDIQINHVNINDCNALILACDRHMLKVCMKLLEYPNINVTQISRIERTALITACNNKLENVCMKILDYPNPINHVDPDGNTALIIACYKKLENVCLKILDHPDIQINNVDSSGQSALFITCINKMENICLKILNHPHLQLTCDDANKLLNIAKNNNLSIVCTHISQLLETKKRKYDQAFPILSQNQDQNQDQDQIQTLPIK